VAEGNGLLNHTGPLTQPVEMTRNSVMEKGLLARHQFCMVPQDSAHFLVHFTTLFTTLFTAG
jgi:hypothetical protein